MPTTTMFRIVQVATGVAGSPYYLTGYFDATLDPQDAADAWRLCLGGGSSTTFVAPYAYSGITSVDLVDPVTGDTVATNAVSVAPITFIGTGDALPPANSLLLRWHTGVYAGGREIRGRTNIARLNETNSTLGVVSAATLTAWQGQINAMLADATVRHVVYSRLNGRWEETVSGSPWDQWAILTSRRD